MAGRHGLPLRLRAGWRSDPGRPRTSTTSTAAAESWATSSTRPIGARAMRRRRRGPSATSPSGTLGLDHLDSGRALDNPASRQGARVSRLPAYRRHHPADEAAWRRSPCYYCIYRLEKALAPGLETAQVRRPRHPNPTPSRRPPPGATTEVSSAGRPMIWKPVGRPSAVRPMGTLAAGRSR